MRLPTKRHLAGLLASAALACASRPPLALHGEIAFPRPEKETCTPGGRAPYRLSVRVRDEQGAAFAGTTVYLFPMGPGEETLVTVKANEDGIAVAIVNKPGVYAVAVAVGGYEPQVRALTLRGSCRASVDFNLRLGPVAGGR
jgi:hypothetical protein